MSDTKNELTNEKIEAVKTLAQAVTLCGGEANAVNKIKFALKADVRGKLLRETNAAKLKAYNELVASGKIKSV